MKDLTILGRHMFYLTLCAVCLLVLFPGTLVTVSYRAEFAIAQVLSLVFLGLIIHHYMGKDVFADILKIALYTLIMLVVLTIGIYTIALDMSLATTLPGLAFLAICVQTYILYRAIRWTNAHPLNF